MRPAQKRGKYITQRRFRGFCELSLEWTYILPITVKLVLFHVNMFLQSGHRQPIHWRNVQYSYLIPYF